MFGKEHSDNPDLMGVIPRSTQSIFDRCDEMKNCPDSKVRDIIVRVSYLEIYMGEVNDLLDSRNHHLDVRYIHGQCDIKDLSEKTVVNTQQILHYINEGDLIRHKNATALNPFSSRSHAIFILKATQGSTGFGLGYEVLEV